MILNLEEDYSPRTFSDEETARLRARRAAIRCALQTVASRLGQRTQEAAGDREMYEGINLTIDWREAMDRRWAALVRAEANRPRKARPTAKPKK
jgi:hypothetical protein